MTDKTKPDILVRDGKELYAHTLLLKVRSLGINRPSRVKYVSPGVPCGLHPACLSHASHPCEGCGRIAGRWLPLTPDHPAFEAWERYRNTCKLIPVTIPRDVKTPGDIAGMTHARDVPPGLYRWRECEACEGTGIAYDANKKTWDCPTCNGHGGTYERASDA